MADQPLQTLVRRVRRLLSPGSAGDRTDARLLEAFTSRRDAAAFAALVARHGPMVLDVCRRLLRDPADCDDAFQATFLVLVRKAGALAHPERLANWLYGVAYRVACGARVTAARRRRLERQAADRPRPEPAANPDASELRALLDEELCRLPDKYRAPVVLCYLEGKTNEEAAGLLGWTRGTLSGRLARARDVLRDRLRRRGWGLPAALFGSALAETASATVPPALATATVRVGLLFAAGRGAGAVPVRVATWTEGALRAMFQTQVQFVAAVVLAVAVLGAGVGMVAWQAGAQPPVPERPATSRQRLLAPAAPPLDDAARAAATVAEPAQRVPLLVEIALAQGQAGQREAALQTLAKALEVAGTVADPNLRLMGLGEIATAQVKLKDPGGALATADTLKEPARRDHLRLQIVRAQADAGDLAGALRTAETMSPDERDNGLTVVGVARAQNGDLAGAQAMAERLRHQPLARASVLEELALAQAKAGNRVAADQGLREALQLQESTLALEEDRRAARGRIAIAQAQAGLIEVALSTTTPLPTGERAAVLEGIAQEQARAGDAAGAQRTLAVLNDPGVKAVALARVAEALAEAGKPDAAAQAFDQAQTVARTVADAARQKGLLATIANLRNVARLRHADPAEALAAVRTFPAPHRASALLDFARHQAKQGRREAAVAAVREALPLVAAMKDDGADPMGVLTLAPRWLLIKGRWARELTALLTELGHEPEAVAWAQQQEPAWVQTVALVGVALGRHPVGR